ncbi:IS5 family transposase [Micromonospora haikouensis]
MASVAVTRRHDLTDAQWRRLAALLPAASTKGRPPKWERRQLIDGIRWRIRIGSPWRDVPAEYGPWQTVYGLFRRWQRDGTWDKILAASQATADARGRIAWTVSVDSMTSRAHQHAAGARRNGHLQKEPPGGVHDEPADHALGRSRGGLTTKTHLACEQGQKVLSMVVTAGHRGDSPQFIPVLRRIKVTRLGAGRPRTCPDLVLADKAYTSRGNRASRPGTATPTMGPAMFGNGGAAASATVDEIRSGNSLTVTAGTVLVLVNPAVRHLVVLADVVPGVFGNSSTSFGNGRGVRPVRAASAPAGRRLGRGGLPRGRRRRRVAERIWDVDEGQGVTVAEISRGPWW